MVSTIKVGRAIVFGMVKEGTFFFFSEDPVEHYSSVSIKLSSQWFYTEACPVLAEGWLKDPVFHINAFGFPFVEPSTATGPTMEILLVCWRAF